MKKKNKESSYPYPSRSYMEEWRKNRYAVFNAKIDAMKDHPKYPTLRKNADNAIAYNEGGGFTMITAADFIKRIEAADVETIRDWLDGKNHLEWNLLKQKDFATEKRTT